MEWWKEGRKDTVFPLDGILSTVVVEWGCKVMRVLIIVLYHSFLLRFLFLIQSLSQFSSTLSTFILPEIQNKSQTWESQYPVP